VRARDLGVVVEGIPVGSLAPLRGTPRPLVDREGDIVTRRPDRALRTEDLHVAARAAEMGAGDAEEELVVPGLDDVERDPADRLGAILERVVYLATQLAADGEVGGRRGDGDGDRHCDRDGDSEAGAEAHGPTGP
jgi:hypothetical protein